MANRVVVALSSLAAASAVVLAAAGSTGVSVVRKDADRRVDVFVDGQPFTSYIWPATLAKPVLYPIRTARGTLVTRGFPLDPRPNERIDHPHHVGLWFNYGDVNGHDFWNNSDAIPADRRPKMGTIVHRGIVSAQSGPHEGVLTTNMDWTLPDHSVVLRQATTYTFRGDATTRSIDLDITLTAQETRVAFTDNKEGVLGLRVTRALEEPASKPDLFTDGAGRPMTVPSLDNTGVNGAYLTSEGTRGAAVWGTRGRWCVLAGRVGDEAVAIAIFDRPGNPGYPTYWHARGYGLFAANPLGQKELSGGKDTLDFALAPKQSARFRYRIVVTSGAPASAETEAAWKEWAK